MNLIDLANELGDPWGTLIKKHDRAKKANFEDFNLEDWKSLKLRSNQFCVKCKELIKKGSRGFKQSFEGYGGFVVGGEYGFGMKMTTSYYIHEKCLEEK